MYLVYMNEGDIQFRDFENKRVVLTYREGIKIEGHQFDYYKKLRGTGLVIMEDGVYYTLKGIKIPVTETPTEVPIEEKPVEEIEKTETTKEVKNEEVLVVGGETKLEEPVKEKEKKPETPIIEEIKSEEKEPTKEAGETKPEETKTEKVKNEEPVVEQKPKRGRPSTSKAN